MTYSINNNTSNDAIRHDSMEVTKPGSINISRRGSNEYKYVAHLPGPQLPLRESKRNPLKPNTSRISLIDGALAIVNSPISSKSISQPRLSARSASLLNARKVNELLLDSLDCLMEKVQSGAFSIQDEDDDCDSDLEDCQVQSQSNERTTIHAYHVQKEAKIYRKNIVALVTSNSSLGEELLRPFSA